MYSNICISLILSFIKLLLSTKKNKFNDNNEKTLKIMKRISFVLLKFSLFPLETIQLEKCKKITSVQLYIIIH